MPDKQIFKIEVFRFAEGDAGNAAHLGHIFRHGNIECRPTASRQGDETPTLRPVRTLVVKAAGLHRVFEETVAQAQARVGMADTVEPFTLKLAADERDPSGLYRVCEHCAGKGHTRS